MYYICTWVWSYSVFCVFLDLFALALTPNWIWFDSSWIPLSQLARGRKEEPEKFETKVTTDGPWWRPRSVVSLKPLASSSSFVLWLRMIKFLLSKGVIQLQKRKEELISLLTHLSHIFIRNFRVKAETEEKLCLLAVWRLGHHWIITTATKLSLPLVFSWTLVLDVVSF